MLDQAIIDKYQVVIGLEVHAQLSTASKIFASDVNEYGNMPNTNVSAITLAHPGTLPRVNKKAVELAVLMGMACGCEINRDSFFDRKNYFYPDLPKGYQTTQDKAPICKGGEVVIRVKDNEEKHIRLNRIHLEDDAGKNLHLAEETDTLVDYNRAGTPLIEIVTEPDLRSSDEAFQVMTELRKLVRYLEVCDGNMEEGSMRCDANVSIMLKGAKEYGKKVEVKNMNSIRNVQRAIDYEVLRQIELIEKGELIFSETRQFDAVAGTTHGMRTKEELNDYRYFPEPDLQPMRLSEETLEEIRKRMPPLPNALFARFVAEYQLPDYDARLLTEEKHLALYFNALCQETQYFKAASNWMMGPVKSFLNERALEILEFPLQPKQLAGIIALVESGKVAFSNASTHIFPLLCEAPNKNPESIAQELNLIQNSDSNSLEPIVLKVLEAWPDKVAEYRSGKKGLLGLFVGEVMKASKGQADPKITNQLVKKHLDA